MLISYYKSIFIEGWSVTLGGVSLGGLAIIMFIIHKPFGVTGGIFELTNRALIETGIGPNVLLGLDELGGCISGGGKTLLTSGIAMTFGTVFGSLIGSTASGEFKLRIPPTPIRYIQSGIGGIFMGYGAGLALGCTIGALFSSSICIDSVSEKLLLNSEINVFGLMKSISTTSTAKLFSEDCGVNTHV